MNSRRSHYSLDKIMRATYTFSQRKKKWEKHESYTSQVSGPLDWLALGAGPRDTQWGTICCVWFWFFFFFFGGVQNKSVGARAVHDCCPLRPKHRQSHYSGITKHRNPPSFDLCVWILPPLKSVETTPLSELLVNFYQFHHWAEKRIYSRHDVHFANTSYSRAGMLNTF